MDGPQAPRNTRACRVDTRLERFEVANNSVAARVRALQFSGVKLFLRRPFAMKEVETTRIVLLCTGLADR